MIELHTKTNPLTPFHCMKCGKWSFSQNIIRLSVDQKKQLQREATNQCCGKKND